MKSKWKGKKIFWWHQNAGGDTVVTPLRKKVSPPASRATPALRGGGDTGVTKKRVWKHFFMKKRKRYVFLKKTKK